MRRKNHPSPEQVFMLEIVKLDHPILRQKGQPVTKFGAELQTLIDEMIEAMREANGVGLAAPQIGQPLQLSVIETLPRLDKEGNELPDTRQLHVIANPQITWQSPEMVAGIEGCLSIPGYLGEVGRHQAIRVKAQDRHGRPLRLHLRGWTARIFQHEIDHLNGVLYIDKLTAPEHFWTEEAYEEMVKSET
jgi:peptide deformylase